MQDGRCNYNKDLWQRLSRPPTDACRSAWWHRHSFIQQTSLACPKRAFTYCVFRLHDFTQLIGKYIFLLHELKCQIMNETYHHMERSSFLPHHGLTFCCFQPLNGPIFCSSTQNCHSQMHWKPIWVFTYDCSTEEKRHFKGARCHFGEEFEKDLHWLIFFIFYSFIYFLIPKQTKSTNCLHFHHWVNGINKLTLKEEDSCCFTLFIGGGPCHLSIYLQTAFWGPYFFLWEQLIFSVMETSVLLHWYCKY